MYYVDVIVFILNTIQFALKQKQKKQQQKNKNKTKTHTKNKFLWCKTIKWTSVLLREIIKFEYSVILKWSYAEFGGHEFETRLRIVLIDYPLELFTVYEMFQGPPRTPVIYFRREVDTVRNTGFVKFPQL
jgi:hypothetical protein